MKSKQKHPPLRADFTADEIELEILRTMWPQVHPLIKTAAVGMVLDSLGNQRRPRGLHNPSGDVDLSDLR